MAGFFLNQVDSYFTDIEDAVSRQRGKRYTANPLDWATMEAWKDRGIQLPVVLRVIAKAQDGIKSLSFHTAAIEKEHAEWLKGQAGASVAVAVAGCSTCNDSGEMIRKPSNAQFDWELEFVPCGACQ